MDESSLVRVFEMLIDRINKSDSVLDKILQDLKEKSILNNQIMPRNLFDIPFDIQLFNYKLKNV